MTCQRCNARAHNAYLCPDCTTELGSLLLELIEGPHHTPGLLEDLADTAAGATRYTEPTPATNGANKDHTPRYNPHASKLAARVHAQLLRIAASLPVRDTIWCPPDHCVPPGFIGPLRPTQRRFPPTYQPTSLELAIWLAGHTHTIANTISAAETYAQIHADIRRIKAAIDRPKPSQPAGTCDCGTRLRAPHDATEVTCPDCGIIYDIDARQRALLAEMVGAGTAFTRTEFPVVLQMLGLPCSPRTFRHWRATGQLTVAGYSETGEALYRPADLPKIRASC